MSITDSVKQTLSAAPGGYLVAWLAGVPVEKWAAFAALVWTLWLIVDKAWGKWKHWRHAQEMKAREKRRLVVEKVVAKREGNGGE